MIHFHRFLIATAILFCVGFSAWTFAAYYAGGPGWQLALCGTFAAAAAALGYYLKNLDRFLHR